MNRDTRRTSGTATRQPGSRIARHPPPTFSLRSNSTR